MPRTYTKQQKAELRRLRELVWERQLAESLRVLEAAFAAWRKGEINAFEVSDLIHDFYRGPRRELFNLYANNNPYAVPGGVANGILDESELSEGLLERLRDDIAHFRGDDER